MDFVEQLNEWGSQKKPFVFLIDFEQKKPLTWPIEACPDWFQFKFTKISSSNQVTSSSTNFDQTFSSIEQLTFENSLIKHPISLSDYQHKYNLVMDALQKGDSFLMNLTIPTPVQNKLDFKTYFDHAKSKYVIWLKEEFIAFSPETFIQIDNGKIATFPMKGTIDASLPNAKELLLNDPKEEGELPKDYASRIGSILYDLLPAGSVSGAPKKKTAELIASIEGADRGYYTGIAGYFDGVNLDSCVLIRYLAANNVYHSGGGITFQSDMASEYQEMINKVYVPVF
jgi:para-aminobenzoate synthetase component 1